MATNYSDALKNFAASQKAFNDRDDAAVQSIQTKFQQMLDEINTLQTRPGPISDEDQKTLDDLQAHGNAFSTSLEVLANSQPPALPTTPPAA